MHAGNVKVHFFFAPVLVLLGGIKGWNYDLSPFRGRAAPRYCTASAK